MRRVLVVACFKFKSLYWGSQQYTELGCCGVPIASVCVLRGFKVYSRVVHDAPPPLQKNPHMFCQEGARMLLKSK